MLSPGTSTLGRDAESPVSYSGKATSSSALPASIFRHSALLSVEEISNPRWRLPPSMDATRISRGSSFKRAIVSVRVTLIHPSIPPSERRQRYSKPSHTAH